QVQRQRHAGEDRQVIEQAGPRDLGGGRHGSRALAHGPIASLERANGAVVMMRPQGGNVNGPFPPAPCQPSRAAASPSFACPPVRSACCPAPPASTAPPRPTADPPRPPSTAGRSRVGYSPPSPARHPAPPRPAPD